MAVCRSLPNNTSAAKHGFELVAMYEYAFGELHGARPYRHERRKESERDVSSVQTIPQGVTMAPSMPKLQIGRVQITDWTDIKYKSDDQGFQNGRCEMLEPSPIPGR